MGRVTKFTNIGGLGCMASPEPPEIEQAESLSTRVRAGRRDGAVTKTLSDRNEITHRDRGLRHHHPRQI